jgi:hypothetical protein
MPRKKVLFFTTAILLGIATLILYIPYIGNISKPDGIGQEHVNTNDLKTAKSKDGTDFAAISKEQDIPIVFFRHPELVEEICMIRSELKMALNHQKAFEWLVAHISKDGYWRSASGQPSDDIELTAVVCISAACSTLFRSNPGKLKAPIKWLIEQQEKDGSFGVNVYQTALVVWALSLVRHESRCVEGIKSKLLWAIINGVKWGMDTQLKNGGWPRKAGETETDGFTTLCWGRALRETPQQWSGGEEGTCAAAITGADVPMAAFDALREYAQNRAAEIFETTSKVPIEQDIRPSFGQTMNWLLTLYRFRKFNESEKIKFIAFIDRLEASLNQDTFTTEDVSSWFWYYWAINDMAIGLEHTIYVKDSLSLNKKVYKRLDSLMQPDGYWTFPITKETVRNFEKDPIGQTALAAFCAQMHQNLFSARLADLYCKGLDPNYQKKTGENKTEKTETGKTDDF